MSASGESGLGAAVRGALKMAEATAEDAVAALDLLHVTGADGPPDDPFEARDPEYIHATLPALRTWSQVYFRADVSGLDRIARRQPLRRHDDRRHVRPRPSLL
jgi:hypothetical protein